MSAPLLIYGVIRSSHRDADALAGGTAARVRYVRSGALTAVVHEVADDDVLGDDDAAAYLDGLVALLPGGPVIPVQFGTVAPDEDAVRSELLEATGDEIARCLDRLEGLVEVRLTVDADAECEIAKLLSIRPEMKRVARAQGHDGTMDFRIELGREASAQLAERRDALSDRLVARLAGRAEAHALLAPYAVTELRHAYLIRSEKLVEFDEAVRELCEDLGDTYDVEYVGPLPAFDFTDVELGSGGERSRWGW